MRIGGIATLEAVHCKREASVLEAALLMRKHHVGDLIVVDEVAGALSPVGILTDRDIVVSLVAEGLDATIIEAGDIMSPELLAASEDADVHETIERMRFKGVRRMPVINAEGGLIGILTYDDMVEWFAEELAAMVTLVHKEQRLERTLDR